MALKRWRWRKVRKAEDVPDDARDLFERFGAPIIAMIVAGGFAPRATELQAAYNDETTIQYATQWLTEQGDREERHNNRLETVEWLILVFLIVGVVADVAIMGHEFGWFW